MSDELDYLPIPGDTSTKYNAEQILHFACNRIMDIGVDPDNSEWCTLHLIIGAAVEIYCHGMEPREEVDWDLPNFIALNPHKLTETLELLG